MLINFCYAPDFNLGIVWHLPLRHLTRPVAGLVLVVEDLTQFATVATRQITVNAHIEELTIIGIRVAWMRYSDALVHLGTLELENILRLAAGNAHLVGPRADAGFRIKDQSSRAGDHIELSVHAEIELITYARFLVAKVAVLSRTVL